MNVEDFYKIDTHVHTHYSRYPKSLVPLEFVYYHSGSPREIILAAVKKGLDGIIVVDQNNLKGSIYTAKVCKDLQDIFKVSKDFQVIPGEEVYTPLGEFNAVGHHEVIGPCLPKGKSWKEFNIEDLCEAIDRAIKLGGVIIAEHPFFDHKTAYGFPLNIGPNLYHPEVLKRVSGIEVYNSVVNAIKWKNPMKIFEKTIRFGMEHGLIQTAGSDNHSKDWVGLAYTYFENEDIIHGLKHGRTFINMDEFKNPSIYNYLTYLETHANFDIVKEVVSSVASMGKL